MKDAFAGFCQKIFEKKKKNHFIGDILVARCFHLNSNFTSKGSSQQVS